VNTAIIALIPKDNEQKSMQDRWPIVLVAFTMGMSNPFPPWERQILIIDILLKKLNG